MNHNLKKVIYPIYSAVNGLDVVKKFKLNQYFKKGQKPWSLGYMEYKFQQIEKATKADSILQAFKSYNIPDSYGLNLDERVFEYPWIFSRLSKEKSTLLDAGSTFNFDFILDNKIVKNKDLTIFTFYPEIPSFPSLSNITYKYGDLRKMELEDETFDEVVSQSTIEHIDMDNAIYGYDLEANENVKQKSYDFLIAIKEMERVLKPGGKLLLTFPYGVFKHYGFFQQFDKEMVSKISDFLNPKGILKLDFALYSKDGWDYSKQEKCNDALSFNPHTGEGKGDDGAAHSRSICLVEFNKSK